MALAKTFVDTNVFVYCADDREPEKAKAARARLRTEGDERTLVVSTQVLQETYVALTRGSDPILPPDAAEQQVSQISRLLVVQVDWSLVLEAIREGRRSRLSFWHALVVRTALSSGCDRLLTEDLNDGQEFGGLTVESPFRTLPRKRRRPR